jgi:hypothetical protein
LRFNLSIKNELNQVLGIKVSKFQGFEFSRCFKVWRFLGIQILRILKDQGFGVLRFLDFRFSRYIGFVVLRS